MQISKRLAKFGLWLALGSAQALATPQPVSAPVVIQGASQFDFVSGVNGRSYRVFIAKPALPAPKAGYPVLYVLDGNAYFSTAAATAYLQSFLPSMGPVVVVGIGYPVTDRMQIEKLRSFDLTTGAPKDVGSLIPGMTPADFGGLDAFYQVIETEIKPLVAKEMPVDPARAAIFGHSYGGLAVLHTLFVHPTAFRSYIAASPSIFWNNRSVLGDEEAFARKVTAGEFAPRILIAVGGEESALWTTLPPGIPYTLDQVNGIVRSARMVDHAKELADRLAALKGAPGYKALGIVYPEENHLSVPPSALSRAVRFAFGVP